MSKTTEEIRPGKLLAVVATGSTLNATVSQMRAVQARYPGLDLVLGNGTTNIQIRNAGVPCGCHTCLAEDREVLTEHADTSWPLLGGFAGMVVCATCGNKRCPHANDHRNDCTSSNLPGQPGSAYAGQRP